MSFKMFNCIVIWLLCFKWIKTFSVFCKSTCLSLSGLETAVTITMNWVRFYAGLNSGLGNSSQKLVLEGNLGIVQAKALHLHGHWVGHSGPLLSLCLRTGMGAGGWTHGSSQTSILSVGLMAVQGQTWCTGWLGNRLNGLESRREVQIWRRWDKKCGVGPDF